MSEVCKICGKQVSAATSVKDSVGAFYCEPCYGARVDPNAAPTLEIPAPVPVNEPSSPTGPPQLPGVSVAAPTTGFGAEHPTQGYNPEQLRGLVESTPAPPHPERIGHYGIIRVLGEGGMGVVYLAEQAQPRRRVALKVIRPAFVNRNLLKRFALEAEVLGRLQHAGIAQIFEAGMAQTATGTQPFFAMELIEGLSLTAFAQQRQLSTKDRLLLIARIAEAVHYAHQKGVIHRDLKPANILVTADGQPKILDFGVARATDSDIQTTTIDTDVGKLIGTLPYMAPEQAGGNPAEIDTRSDVYALGVIAYELLAGQRPHNLENKMIHEAVRIIQQDEPSRLSSINRTLRGDIETIVAKALEKTKDRRYQSASEFATDIARHLNNQPISARPASTAYQLAKFAHRNKVLVGGVAAVFLVLLLGVIGTGIGLVRARDAVQAQRLALADSQKQRALTEKQSERANAEKLRATEESTNAQLQLADATVARGDALVFAARFAEARQVYRDAWSMCDKLHVSSLPAELGIWDCDRRSPPAILTLRGHKWTVISVALAPDGRTALSGCLDKTVKLWDLATGNEIRTLTGHTDMVCCAALAPDARTALSGSNDGTLKLWDVATGKELRTLSGQAGHVAFAPDGRTALSSGARNLTLWDLATGQALRTFGEGGEGGGYSVAFAPDGRTALSGSKFGTLKLWDLATGHELRTVARGAGIVYSVAFAPDGRTALTGNLDQTLKLCDVATGQQLRTLVGHAMAVHSVAVAADGRTAISGSADQTLKLWDLATGNELRTLVGHTGTVFSVALAPNGRTALSGSDDGTLKLWDVATESRTRTGGTESVTTTVAFGPDARMALSGSKDGALKLWDLATGKEMRTLTGHTGFVRHVAFAPDGRTAISESAYDTLTLWDLATGREVRTLKGRHGIISNVALAPDGRTALSGNADKTLTLWDLGSGNELHTFTGHTGVVRDVAIAPDGRMAVSGSDDGTVRLWDLATGKALRTVTGFAGNAGLAFAPDGRAVLSGGGYGNLSLWEVATGKVLRTFTGAGIITSVAFAPDGRTVLTGSWDHTLKFWDVATGRELHTFTMNNTATTGIIPIGWWALAPVGLMVLSAGDNNTIALWDFSRPTRDRTFEPLVARAQTTLGANPDDGVARVLLGEWFAYRGADTLAIEDLEKARSVGAAVSPLALARCYWKVGKLADAAREFQHAIDRKEAPAEYLNLCRVAIAREGSAGGPDRMPLVEITPGTFTMGSPPDEVGHRADEVQHQVTLTKPFKMGIYHVTIGQFKTFVEATGYKTAAETDDGNSTSAGDAGGNLAKNFKFTWRTPGFAQSDDHPVVCVNWDDAMAFCKWLSAKEGKHFRLPTEAEWEYACRANTRTAYVWGNNPDDGQGWCNAGDQTHKEAGNTGVFFSWRDMTLSGFVRVTGDFFSWRDGFTHTSPVGSFKSNAFGLYDMHGNANEWCLDWYGDYPKENVTDPQGPQQGQQHVLRGGAWDATPQGCRAGNRGGHPPTDRLNSLGFRVVQDVP